MDINVRFGNAPRRRRRRRTGVAAVIVAVVAAIAAVAGKVLKDQKRAQPGPATRATGAPR